jgi:hypothetical protein
MKKIIYCICLHKQEHHEESGKKPKTSHSYNAQEGCHEKLRCAPVEIHIFIMLFCCHTITSQTGSRKRILKTNQEVHPICYLEDNHSHLAIPANKACRAVTLFSIAITLFDYELFKGMAEIEPVKFFQ